MKNARPEYDGGTVVQVIERDAATGVPTSAIVQDTDGNKWHTVKDKDAVLLRDESEVEAAVSGK